MLEIIKKQFESKKSITLNRNFSLIKRELWPTFFWDLYPLAQEYYHELNPYFLSNIYSLDFYKYYNMFTVRDGMITFANFIMSHFNSIPKLGTKLYLIHPDFAPFVPQNLTQYFGTWHISRPNPLKLSEAKKIVIFAFVSEQYLGNPDDFPHRLKFLKEIHPKAEVELYLPLRKSVFALREKETVINYQLLTEIQKILAGRSVKFLTSEHFMEKTSLKDTVVVDLARDKNLYVSDSYFDYFVHSRGGTIFGANTDAPKDSIFDLALSFHHNLHITPFPDVQSAFGEILFYKKTSQTKDHILDPNFHDLLKTIIKGT